MNKLEGAIYEMNLIKEQADSREKPGSLSPFCRVFLTVWYILLTVSFDKYDIFGLLGMGLYPLVIFITDEIPFGQCMKRIRIVLPFLFLMGAVNPIFDKSSVGVLGEFVIRGGHLSMLTLMIKGFFSLLAGYLLIVSVSIEKICASLLKLHIPAVLVTMLLLIYRYLSLLLEEADKMTKAYMLRAPGQKGIRIRAWGSLTGLLLLRSMDRAESVYESMQLRGFDADSKKAFSYSLRRKEKAGDYVRMLGFAAALLFLRICPLFILAGRLLTRGWVGKVWV